MTAADPAAGPSPSPSPTPSHAAEEAAVDQFAGGPPIANPALIGVPTFLVGSIALALTLTDYSGAQLLPGAPLAIIFAATGIGQLIATIFALRAGESAVASVFGIFTGFWLSYAALVLGVVHNWFGTFAVSTPVKALSKEEEFAMTGANAVVLIKVFVLSWLILVVLLTLVSLRLPLAFTVLFVLVDLALLFVLLAYVNVGATGPSTTQLKIGGYFAWAFIVVGAYLFLDAMAAATGGKNLPLGRGIIK